MMRIGLAELIAAIEEKNEYPLDPEQKQAISHGTGPLLIAAGPGTGKTEVLLARCLKFICCDGVDPGSVMVTTFTEKAAKNLEDRLLEALLFLQRKHVRELEGIDPSELRIDTLHGLCNDILQEYRYTEYQNLRLLDDMETALLVHRTVVNELSAVQKHQIFTRFRYLFDNRRESYQNRWHWALALTTIFNRLVDDQVNLEELRAEGGPWLALYEANQVYEEKLAEAKSCDFARLLRYFQQFLGTGQGESFLGGDGNLRKPLTHVLVDEYQDTNPIQESIYLRLCDQGPHNLTVVGDDDQAVYRFRGGTVECMVGFGPACEGRWDLSPKVVYLSDNHRSDKRIVEWCNHYITSFPVMRAPNVRIPGKPALRAAIGETGPHPALSLIRSPTIGGCAAALAELIGGLQANGIIQDYSQCVLLLRSTKSTPRFAKPYEDALEEAGIPVYNPRSKAYLEQDEVAQCLGALIRIVDPFLAYIGNVKSPAVRKMVNTWVGNYDGVAHENEELVRYVQQGAQAISMKESGERVTTAMPTILYRILCHSPFAEYQANPAMDLRLSKLTRLFESFCAQYGRGLWMDDASGGEVSGRWLGSFYYGFCGYLEQKGLDDDEDEEEICPSGFFPIMTIHQAKGLEFDFVFVGNLGAAVQVSSAHQLEADLRDFRCTQPILIHSVDAAMWQDDIRQHFVAYSRAKSALILVARDGQLQKGGEETASFGAEGGGSIPQNLRRL